RPALPGLRRDHGRSSADEEQPADQSGTTRPCRPGGPSLTAHERVPHALPEVIRCGGYSTHRQALVHAPLGGTLGAACEMAVDRGSLVGGQPADVAIVQNRRDVLAVHGPLPSLTQVSLPLRGAPRWRASERRA